MNYDNLGGLEEETREEEKVTAITDAGKKAKKPFHYWKVSDREYKLKLTTAMILKLENKYRCNLSTLVLDGDIPPLAVMLTLIHAAMSPWEHGISYLDVQKIYDKWTEEEGNQHMLFANVVIPVMAVSGFFTESQSRTLIDAVKEEMENMN